jgi:uncharacterized protein (TIGR00661 family)
MRILYGVVGEGMGHAMRSRVVLEHLLSSGHHVEIVASGRAADFLAKRFAEEDVHDSPQAGRVHPGGVGAEGAGGPRMIANVNRIHGLHIIYDENRIRRGATLWSNVVQGTAALPGQIKAYFELIDDFEPEGVISDFESWTYLYAKSHGIPVISIDNMQIINRAKHPPEIVEGHRADFELARAFVKSKLPFCDHYLVTTFFYPPLRKERTSLHPPILRPEILAAQPSRGEHLLVYQTAEGNEGLVETLARTGMECRIYGMRRAITEEEVEGNLRYRPFAEQGFIDDLASARAVIGGGGFTLMGECVYLHKPMLAVPVGGQFEQVLNARWLEKLGYGRYADALDDAGTVHDFVAGIAEHERALEGYAQDDNRDLFDAVDQHLDRMAAGVY